MNPLHNPGMNEELELRQRLAQADPAASSTTLNEGVVAKAALGKPSRFTSFRVARLTMAAASLSIVGLAVTSLSLPQAAQEPLFVLAQGAAQNTSAMSAEAAPGDGKMVADSMIMPWFRYNYIAGDLSTEIGRGKVYQAELVGDPIEILNRLAGYFGVEGEPKLDEWATPEFPSYSVMSNNKSLSIYFSGAGSWYYSSWRDYDYSCSTISGEGADDSGEVTEERVQEYCDPKPTPELIPAEAELVRQAVELFRGIGTEVDSSAARVWRDDWGASVNFPNIQNGINTGMDFYVGWDMAGQISYASGYSFRLVERGEFDTISALDAVPRIADGRWYGGAANHYYENLSITSDAAVSSPMARSTEEVSIDADGEKVEIAEPGIVYEEPEVMDLMVVRSEIATLSVFDAAGNFWFVPGYLLFNEQGWFDSIISLEEGIIQLPEPFNYGVMPVEEPQG